MNERVFVLREAVVKITQMLSGKGINVSQRGVNAYVKVDHMGRPILVNLPYLPDNASDELCGAIQGFLDHEVAHILFTDFAIGRIAEKLGVMGTTNILEDARIEKCMAGKFTGSASNLSTTGQFFLDKYTTPKYQEALAAGNLNEVQSYLMVPLIRSMAGQMTFKEYMKDKMHLVNMVYERIKDLQPRIEAMSSTKDALEIAKMIKERLKDESETPSKEKGKEKSDKKAESKDGKQKDGKSDKEGNSDKSDKSKEGKPEKPEKEGKSDKSDKNAEDKDAEDKNSGKSDSDSEKDAEDKSNKDAGNSGDEEGEGESGGSGAEGDDEISDGGEGTTSEGENAEEGVTQASLIFEEIDKEGINGYDETLSKLVSQETIDAASSAEYLVYTKDDDVVEPMPIGSGYNSSMLVSLIDAVEHMVGPLQKDLERAIAARSLAVWENGKRAGRLAPANLSRLAVGDSRVFRKKTESTTKDVAVELVVDVSGSMGGQKIHIATQAAYALSAVLERIGIKHEVICFTTGGIKDADRLQASARLLKGTRYSRSESIYMPILKSFNDRLTTGTKERFGWLPHSNILRNNIDGECVEIAARRLLARRETGKIMIVLSDGAPACAGDNHALQKHLKSVVKRLERTGKMKIVGIGIQSEAVKNFYDKKMVINDIEELPSVIMKELRHLLIG